MKKLAMQIQEVGDLPPETPQGKADRIRHERLVALLDQVRALIVAQFIGFVVLCTVGTLGFVLLRAEARAGREQNKVAICDLYRQVHVDPPSGLDCPP